MKIFKKKISYAKVRGYFLFGLPIITFTEEIKEQEDD